MKKTLGIGAGVGVLGLLLWMGTALGFSAVSADAGYFGNLTVLGSCTGPGCGGAGGGVIADAGNFIAVSIDGGNLELDNSNPGFYGLGPCDGGNGPYCSTSSTFTWLGSSLYMNNSDPQITFCNTSILASPWDGGLCANIFLNATGQLEFNTVYNNAQDVQSQCDMQILTGSFNCQQSFTAPVNASYNEWAVQASTTNPDSVPAVENYNFLGQQYRDPLADGGIAGLFIYGVPITGFTGSLRNLYFEDPAIGAGSGWQNIDFSGAQNLRSLPAILGSVDADAGDFIVLQAEGSFQDNGTSLVIAPAVFDGGAQFSTGNSGTRGELCVGSNGGSQTFAEIGYGACVNGAPSGNSAMIESNGVDMYINQGPNLTGHAYIYGNANNLQATFGSNNGHNGILAPNLDVSGATGLDGGVNIGAGAKFVGQEFGTCTLSSGTCNAVVQGASGNSLCYCGIQGTYARDAGAVTCSAQADAGSATCYCYYASLVGDPAPAPVGIHCDN